MSYDYDKFVHPVPEKYTILKGTQGRLESTYKGITDVLFFTALHDIPVLSNPEVTPFSGTERTYYLDYDITRVPVPTDPLSVIYNVTVTDQQELFPIGLLSVHGEWALVDKEGNSYYCSDRKIESFVTTPPAEETKS